MNEAGLWRRCSACKQPIRLGATYWVCNVSTCNRARTALVFCTVTCWEVHLPGANHRESWALERIAPARPDDAPSAPRAASPPAPQAAGDGGAGALRPGQRRLVRPPGSSGRPAPPREILIVASRLKDYIRTRSGMHASDAILDPLSEAVRALCDEAILRAEREGRRTVLERDIPKA